MDLDAICGYIHVHASIKPTKLVHMPKYTRINLATLHDNAAALALIICDTVLLNPPFLNRNVLKLASVSLVPL